METLSVRGKDFVAQKPTFFDVLGDLWDPKFNPNGIVNIGLAENTLMHAELEDFINTNSKFTTHALTYGDGFSGSHNLKEAICHFLNNQLSPTTALNPSHLAITSGVSNAVECCAWALADIGDYILVGRPYFNAFKTTLGTRPDIKLLEVSFGDIDPFSLEAVQVYQNAYEEARGKGLRVRALILCSPHNPLGRCYPEHVLREYMRLCGRSGLHLVSDEIYALTVWDNPRIKDAPRFKSILSMGDQPVMDPSMIHAVWGLSKDFGATGLRLGCLISQANMALIEAAEGISLYNFPSSLADQVATSLLRNDEFVGDYIVKNRMRLADSYLFATEFLRNHGIPYLESNAGLFVWMNIGAAVQGDPITDHEVVERLRKEKVYIATGAVYASEETGWFRMVFAHPKDVLEEGLNRLLRAIDVSQ
ncbi:unnamed protein product [Penicillium olsonii]|uniref:Aminotransferase class I/classII large domain-containing protein n=1 Tax=Penicillium olsonii TaxID=99116 RepID=A0A9W4HLV5_PENOL|nr:unnamed protein product [Penicillium olsonii]CAG8290775.1 unnamed protein product [Penicillium olsonii]